MAQEPPPSLVTRVFSHRIAQAVGIFGVAFTLFQGLEPLLKFSRFMAYLVHHWRELTRGLWSSLASLVNLDPPAWALDLLTAMVFIVLFTARSWRHSEHLQMIRKRSISAKIMVSLPKYLPQKIFLSKFWGAVVSLPLTFLGLSFIMVVPAALFLAMHAHIGLFWSAVSSFVLSILYMSCAALLSFRKFNVDGTIMLWTIVINSEHVMFVLIILLVMNYVALYSHAIEAFIEQATQ